MSKISIVIPVYFNDMNLIDLYADMKEKALSNFEEYEIVMVDDGSKDQSYEIMKQLQEKDSNIKLVKLSRNFGSHAAILAGFAESTGDCVAIKMADLQEPSELLVDMYKQWKDGYNVVLAVREDRDEPISQKFFSGLYYKIMKKIAISSMPEGGFDCFLADRKVIDVLLSMDEKNSTLMGQVLWCGFKRTEVYYKRLRREKGESQYNLSKKIKLFVDSLLSFSYFPIRFISFLGIVIFIVAAIWLLYILTMKLTVGVDVEGWTSLMMVNLFFYGMILLTLGIIGEYLWRTLDAARPRPIYIIEEIKEKKNHGKK